MMGIRPQIIAQTSNTLSKFQDYQPPKMGIRSQNMAQTSSSLLSASKSTVARGNQW